ncbi:MAG: PEGA domain-containing protein [Desulfovibrio sp.]
MNSKKILYMLLSVVALLAVQGCNAALTQSVPVSTNPLGAKLYADGQYIGETPQAVDLDRSKDHILTMTKDGYQQVDVSVKRHYQQDKVLRNAVSSGISNGEFFKSGSMGIQSGLASMQQQEDSGEAYVLMPQTVSVRLQPVGAASTAPVHGAVMQPVQPTHNLLEYFQAQDYSSLSNALERTPSGQVVRWSNPSTGTDFTVTPRPASEVDGTVTRYFNVSVTRFGNTMSGSYNAMRSGPSNWEVMRNAPTPAYGASSVEPTTSEPTTAMSTEGALKGILEGAAASAPTMQQSFGSTHSKSHESFGPGSYSKSTSSTSTSVGVSVNPLGALKALEDLTHAAE